MALQHALKRNLPPDHPAQNSPTYEWTSRDYGTASTNAIDKHGRDPRGWTFGGCASLPFLSLFGCALARC